MSSALSLLPEVRRMHTAKKCAFSKIHGELIRKGHTGRELPLRIIIRIQYVL